jgi:ADP-ribose pyrophosphatase
VPVPEAEYVRSETLFTSSRFALMNETFATSDGEVVRPVIHHPGAVAIIAQPDPAYLVLVRQFRYPLRRWTLEIPAGTRVPGEEPMATAARELQEEAGFAARSLVEITRFFPAVGVSDEEMILYRASGLSPVAASPERGELVAREVVALTAIPSLLAVGELCDAKTLIALAVLGLPCVASGRTDGGGR